MSAIFATISSHAIPRQTMPPSGTMTTQPWPFEPTIVPTITTQLVRRDFNTVCGYIGGNADRLVTCIAGSHCVVDAQHQAIGCCPNGGDCAKGIFTGCVDGDNPGHGVVDPHVFTCGVGDVCYRNTFEGGFFQYGCGSASDMATAVALTASDEAAITHTTVSVSLRPATTLASATGGDGGGSSSASGRDIRPIEDHTRELRIVGIAVCSLFMVVTAAQLVRAYCIGNVKTKEHDAEEGPNYTGQVAHTISARLRSLILYSPGSEEDYDGGYDGGYDGDDNMTEPRGTEDQYEDVELGAIPPATKGGDSGSAKTATNTDQTGVKEDTELEPIPPATKCGSISGCAKTATNTDQTGVKEDTELEPIPPATKCGSISGCAKTATNTDQTGRTEETEPEAIAPAITCDMSGCVKTATSADETRPTEGSAVAPINMIEDSSPVGTGSMPRRGGERPFWQQTAGRGWIS